MAAKKPTSALKKVQDEISHVYKTIYQGNGKPSIINQISHLESNLKNVHSCLEKQIEQLEDDLKCRSADLTNFYNEKLESSEKNINTRIEGLHNEVSLKLTHITEVVQDKFTVLAQQIQEEFQKKKIDQTGAWTIRNTIIASTIAAVASLATVALQKIMLFQKIIE